MIDLARSVGEFNCVKSDVAAQRISFYVSSSSHVVNMPMLKCKP